MAAIGLSADLKIPQMDGAGMDLAYPSDSVRLFFQVPFPGS
jgi:hypothetical protein